MTINTQHGSPSFPTASSALAPSSREEMDRAIGVLVEQKDNWVKTPVAERIRIVDSLIADFSALAPRWVAASLQAKGLEEDSPYAGEEWVAGTWALLHSLRQLRQALIDIQQDGHPHIPGPIRTRHDGQVKAQVFPFRPYDRVLFPGVKAEVWMQPGVTAETLASTQAVNYQAPLPTGKVALVLGAGNVASIGPLDVLYKLFTDNQVVLFKANPVNAYLGPLMAEAFHSLIDAGYLRIVHGGAEEGSYLCQHASIDEIHITGSDKTFDAIVFGPGAEGAARKAARQPLVTKRVTGELGNVSPVIVVPGPWNERDMDDQAIHIASMLVNNAGYNCNATRVIIQHKDWALRPQLLQQVRNVLSQLPTRKAYYPGARQRYQDFVAAHPEAEEFGGSNDPQNLPWTLISDVDATNKDDICFTTEAFCSLFAETALDAASVVDYIERAVQFANEQLWGTLNATLLVHPRSLQDPTIAEAVGRAIAQLRYGSIGVNYWAGTSFVLGSTTWGAFPGHEIYDIQSGNDVVHNSLMFSRAQKSVVYAPFRSIPTPPWFTSQARSASKLFRQLTQFEQSPSWLKLPAIVKTAILG
ncbi:aldehyde dehydrogenase family protein [Dictyobacter aurantiacus]|uniref:Putative aldehyde dehydrogenase n=1 Tax=Dictyobacter aurantiacus TaxID=1936993 RepID=A0A401ZGT2_9CHLR|nr:aldehyde dehydrogenase family protein [Dictyobacter aurantiacus]GCE05898.1 putative aldehyde dehydrogenase [Dictyobacter aurantiacus]